MPERREGDVHTSRRPLCSPQHGWSPGSGWGATHGQGRTTGGGGSRRGRGRGWRTCSFHTREKPRRAQRPLPVPAAPAPLRAGSLCPRLILPSASLGDGVGDTRAQDGTTDSAGHTTGGGLRRDDVAPAKTLGEGSRVGHFLPSPGCLLPSSGGEGKGIKPRNLPHET